MSFHPSAISALWHFAPRSAGKATGDRRILLGLDSRSRVAESRTAWARLPADVVVRPGRDGGVAKIEAKELALIQNLVAHASIAALAEAVLHRLSGAMKCQAAGRQAGPE